MRSYYIFISALGLLVATLITASFSIMGNPFDQKLKAQDDLVISDFTVINNSVNQYYSTNRQLPQTLEQTSASQATSRTGKYRYEIISETSYRLCATFLTDSRNQINPNTPPVLYPAADTSHPKGDACILYQLPGYLMVPTPAPTNIPPETGDQILSTKCNGQIKNGTCIVAGCTYSYPLDIYSKGQATDINGKVFENTCDSTGQEVNLNYCSQSSGFVPNFVPNAHTFSCHKGCQNGACIK